MKPHKEEPPKKGPANKVVPDPSDSERVEETEAEGIQVAPKTKAKSKRKTILTSLEEEVKRQGKKGSGKNLGLRMAATFKADGLGGENGRMTVSEYTWTGLLRGEWNTETRLSAQAPTSRALQESDWINQDCDGGCSQHQVF